MAHCLSVLKGIYSDTPCTLGVREEFESYIQDINAGMLNEDAMEEKWGGAVRRSWKALTGQEEGSVMAKEILMGQLDEFDRIFKTHFEKAGDFFLTTVDEWTDAWPLYVDSLIQHVKEAAERLDSNKTFVDIREKVAGKVRFMMQDHGALYVQPPIPILTKSMVPMMIKTVDDIELALYEVSHCHTFSSQSLHLGLFSKDPRKLESYRVCQCFPIST
jgi:hypothetical protein